ncbi:hypothetical protein [Cellulosilyticum sp. I15G10I2]|uniref:hypothetical protein n=1 Tax=Cellulosilyticum sp. I15G10I2 TaxID=1892843 RepID=UPI00085C2B36|nr:hypothetical protein [Cellulosilyticum sp. I15G10I2]
MEKIKEELKRYKWLWIFGVVVALSMGVLAANMHVITFMHAYIKEDTANVIRLISKDIKNEARQDSWYFKKGIDYLLEDASEESLDFLEESLEELNADRQYDVIKAYNSKKILFKDHKVVIQILMQDLGNSIAQDYLKRVDVSKLDQELFYYFGDKPAITNEFIDTLYQILTVYPKQLPLDQFQFDLYNILTLEGEEGETKKSQIFSKLEPEAAKLLLFKELKTKPVDLDVLNTWVEFLNKSKVLTGEEYAGFTNHYAQIQLMRSQYKRLSEQEVDLKNKKEMIEVEIGDKLKLLESNQKAINALKYEVSDLEQELEKLTDYAHMAFYIDKAYGNGEYEASVPRKNLFGNYKSSSQKYILKLSTTEFYQEGVYYVDVYLNGTKVNPKGNEYPHYIEVPKGNLERISTLSRSRGLKVDELESLTNETAKLQTQVESVKKETGYEENELALENLHKEREGLTKKIGSKIVEIKNMLGIGNVSMRDL